VTVWHSLLTTASEVYEPKNGWGVLGLLVLNGGGLLTAIGALWLIIHKGGKVQKSAEAVREDTAAVKAQVVNGHPDPMRADLDKALEGIDRLTGLVEGLYKLFGSLIDRRSGNDRRQSDQPHHGPDRRSGHDRRN
jgi:hypothetical protein